MSLSTTGYGDITPVTDRGPADQRPGHHAAAGGVPDRADRHHRRDPDHAVAAGPEDSALEEQSAQPHRRRRLRHQGPHRGRRDDRRRGRAGATSSSSTPTRPPSTGPTRAGLVTVRGDATKSDVLRLAGAQHAKAIIVATNSDDDRRAGHPDRPRAGAQRQDHRLGPRGREPAPAAAVRCGLDGGVLGDRRPAAGPGHLQRPSVVEMIEDLLTPDAGFAIAEREVETKEVGGSPRHLSDIVLGVVRDGKLLRVDDAAGRRPGAGRPDAVRPQRRTRPMSDG